MRQSINYNLDMLDAARDRWWNALLTLQNNYPQQYAARMEACNRQIGVGMIAQAATLEAWIEEIKKEIKP